MKQHDKDGNGTLSFEEFTLVFENRAKLSDDVTSSKILGSELNGK